MLNKISIAIDYAQRNGWNSLYRLALSKLQVGLKTGPKSQQTIVAKYDALIAPSFGVKISTDHLDKKTINWFIPPVGKGSGGHLNIFRFIRNLEALGYQNRIIIVGSPQPKSAEVAKKNINEWFFSLKADVYIDNGCEIPPAFFSMATEWRTAYFVKRFLSCVHRCYFVQDFEPWFYSMGTDYIFAENTYRFGFHGFTAGTWLAEKLATDYGMQTTALGFSYDRDLYNVNQSSQESSQEFSQSVRAPKVFFYARPPTKRRAFELGLLVLREVKKRMPQVCIVMAGWDMRSYKIPFQFENAGLVDLNKLAQLYRQCDVALVLSFSNVSLLPLELMACGIPVVSNKAPFTEWLLNDENALLAEPNIEALADAVVSVLENPTISNKLKRGGFNYSRLTSWELEAEKLAEGIEGIHIVDGRKDKNKVLY